jgi:tripartite-type tricarboxylate transporter receptor subunit TctC
VGARDQRSWHHGGLNLISLIKLLTPRAAIAGLMLIGVQIAQAQPYPSKLIRLVTGSAAGGGADITARQIAPKLAEAFGQQVLVDNRPGLAGMLANEMVAKAPADGYTLLLQPGGFITLSAQLNSKAGKWETLRHLAPVMQVSSYTFVLVVHPSVPAKTVKELIAVGKASPRALSFVSSGVGSNFHLSGELFRLRAGIEMWHVPYKGSPPAIVDLIAGRAEMMFVHIPAVLQYVRNGRLRALGLTGTQRSELLPNVPTIAEAALPGYDITGSEGLFAPAGTPRDIVLKINTAVAAILGTPELKEMWAAKGVAFSPSAPEQYSARLRDEYEKTAAVIRSANIKSE